ncbi:glutenin, high molecular weight subunit PW212 isoform X2 [Myripristis murdjan]|uniref:glutenin, high molecular weight subunit PW212 isoform X2 n=1 Tax=Myripristis murdjan TaxID=586833 RepID=UPI001175F396|nr:glutenin, high molecular weight subunit PW212 isoform X2 [Myripristis murdjan]
MAAVCWTVVALAFVLSAGPGVDAVEQRQLKTLVTAILKQYRISGQFSLAVNIPLNEVQKTQTVLRRVFREDRRAKVTAAVSRGDVYIGTWVVAAGVDTSDGRHAESRVLDNFNALFNKPYRSFLLFYSYHSPCDLCLNEIDPATNMSRISIIQNWRDYALVFSRVLQPKDSNPLNEENLRESLERLGNTTGLQGQEIGLASIFRCDRKNGLTQCNSCSASGQVSHQCVVDSSQASASDGASGSSGRGDSRTNSQGSSRGSKKVSGQWQGWIRGRGPGQGDVWVQSQVGPDLVPGQGQGTVWVQSQVGPDLVQGQGQYVQSQQGGVMHGQGQYVQFQEGGVMHGQGQYVQSQEGGVMHGQGQYLRTQVGPVVRGQGQGTTIVQSQVGPDVVHGQGQYVQSQQGGVMHGQGQYVQSQSSQQQGGGKVLIQSPGLSQVWMQGPGQRQMGIQTAGKGAGLSQVWMQGPGQRQMLIQTPGQGGGMRQVWMQGPGQGAGMRQVWMQGSGQGQGWMQWQGEGQDQGRRQRQE